MDTAKLEWAKKAKTSTGKNWPVGKIKKAAKLAEKMKAVGEITNPHALARWAVARGAKVAKVPTK